MFEAQVKISQNKFLKEAFIQYFVTDPKVSYEDEHFSNVIHYFYAVERDEDEYPFSIHRRPQKINLKSEVEALLQKLQFLKPTFFHPLDMSFFEDMLELVIKLQCKLVIYYSHERGDNLYDEIAIGLDSKDLMAFPLHFFLDEGYRIGSQDKDGTKHLVKLTYPKNYFYVQEQIKTFLD